jgi:putative nucleotidyltransferase with HDIG domain
VRKLPTIPRVYGNLTAVMAREDPTVAEVAGIVAEDSAVVAKVLHVVNSAFFRVARPITSIEQAVAYLGFGPIRSLVLSSEVFQQWPAAIASEFEPQQLQAHARDVAAATYALARETPWAEEALIAGLLHDIGYWVLLQERPSEMLQTLQLARDAELALPEAERKVFGTTHAEVGAYLLGLWGLQSSIVEAVAFHHAPLGLPHDRFDSTAALAMAHLIDEASGPESSFEGRWGAQTLLDEAARASFHAPFDWLEAERRVAESREPRVCS